MDQGDTRRLKGVDVRGLRSTVIVVYGVIAVMAALWTPEMAGAQDALAQVRGRVQETGGAAIADAQVQLLERRARFLVGSNGRFAFDGILPGTYTLRVDRIGYQVNTQTISANGRLQRVQPPRLPSLGFRWEF
jgi:hypothetical protein